MLADGLKRLRSDRGLGMSRLAELSGLSRAHLYALEGAGGANPTRDTLHKLATGLASWRDGVPDPAEYPLVLRDLQGFAGLSSELPEPDEGDLELKPVPEPLARSLMQILENWPRWGQTEREHAAQLLDVVSHFGRDADTVIPDDSPTPEMKHSNNLALYLDWDDLDPLRTARAPVRELVAAGR